MSKRDNDILLEDILNAIEKALRYTEGFSLKRFVNDEKTVDAVARNIEVIGEATTKLPDEIKDQFPMVEWRRIKGMHNRIVHEYFGIDVGILWTIVTDHLPVLKNQIQDILLKIRSEN